MFIESEHREIESEEPGIIQKLCDTLVVSKDQLDDKAYEHLNEDHCSPVVFKRLKIDMNFYAGSQETWQFHKNLVKFYTDQKDIFNTEAIQKIMLFKSEQSNYVLKFMTFLVTTNYIVFATMT